eukprot:6176802-Pleurochrysis_carterae.AAC.5
MSVFRANVDNTLCNREHGSARIFSFEGVGRIGVVELAAVVAASASCLANCPPGAVPQDLLASVSTIVPPVALCM